MKKTLGKFSRTSSTVSLSLIVTFLLVVAIVITINSALTRQEKNTSAAYKTPSITCAPRPDCLDSVPKCEITEPVEGWCPPKPSNPQ